MAVSVLPTGDGSSDEPAIVAEINVTPLTDIFLVLLIIFMVTTTAAVNEGKNIDLPSAEVAEQTTPKGVTVQVDDEGAILINEVSVSEAELEAVLSAAVEAAEDKVVVLKGDKRVLLGQAVNILDLAQKAGAEGIAIATQKVKGQ